MGDQIKSNSSGCFGIKPRSRFCLTVVVSKIKFTEKNHLETPLEENVNRIIPEEGTEEARTIEDAIAVLRYIYGFYYL